MILDVFRKSVSADFAIPPDAEIDWFAIATRAPQDGRYRPCVQQSGRFAGFFVAQTSRAADPTKDICDPAHWISSTDIPYITLPGNRLRVKGVAPGDLARAAGVAQVEEHERVTEPVGVASLGRGMRQVVGSQRVVAGDLALVHRKRQGVDQIVVAVAADTGNANELGEASIALHIALGNPAAGRLPGNIADGVTTLLFPGHRAEQPITAATLAAKRGALLEAVGGETAVRACGAS